MISKKYFRVTFHKRAQIFISDLWSLFKGEGLGRFDDISTLTMFADYRVPQSLQYFGVMKYSEVRNGNICCEVSEFGKWYARIKSERISE